MGQLLPSIATLSIPPLIGPLPRFIMDVYAEQLQWALTYARARASIAKADLAYKTAIREAAEAQALRYHHTLSQIMPEVDVDSSDDKVVDEDDSNDEAVDKDNGNVKVDENGDKGIVQVQDDDTYNYVRGQETSRGKDPYPERTPGVVLKPSPHSTWPTVRHIQIHLV